MIRWMDDWIDMMRDHQDRGIEQKDGQDEIQDRRMDWIRYDGKMDRQKD